MKGIQFEELSSPEIGVLAEKKAVILVPIGACEEHGRHLPVVTDTRLAYQACLDTADKVKDTIPIAVLPPVFYGYSVAVLKNWPGTVTIRPKVLIDFMYDICTSLIDMGLDRILIVNGHGNNPGVLDVVVRTVGDDHKVFPGVVNIFNLWDAQWIRENRKSKEGGISHAGEAETSIMLHLSPELVDMSLADGTDIMTSSINTCPVDPVSPRKKKLFLSTWFVEDSLYGGAGDPSVADAEFGKRIHDMAVNSLAEVIRDFHDVMEKYDGRILKRKNTRF
ncbi:MAG: creatininase family protein [Spirochaetales bacterium]|nr:MAG: creatininase family protein [Spirochaetales bacterium]